MTRTPNGIRTYDYANQPSATCTNDQNPDGCLDQWLNAHPNGTLLSSTDKNTWDATGTNKGSAVEAHYYAGLVYDFYKSKFGRNGIDNADMEIQSNVHFSTSFANAFWDGIGMVYGDGDNLQLKLTTKGYDVIAHELTHGVTEHESALEYQDQSGALNESVSDIFGCFAEHVAFPDPVANWTIGEKVAGVLLGTKLRDMGDPGSVTLSPQPDNMSKYTAGTADNGGVHTNSGIPNNAAYLMTMGGTNHTSSVVVSNGIGWDKAEQVWYRAATEYFTSTSDFAAAAQATLTAATDLGMTGAEKATIECAWIATGVITNPAACRADASDAGPSDAARVDAGIGTTDAGPGVDAGGGDAGNDAADSSRGADAAPVDASGGDAATFDAGAADVTVVDSAPVIDAGTGGGNGTSPTSTTTDVGCACRTSGGSRGGSGGALAAAAVGAFAFARRRRSRRK
jgi:MYXO-CTERM domain-containing protein